MRFSSGDWNLLPVHGAGGYITVNVRCMRGRQRNETERESKRGRQGNDLAHAHINRHYHTNECALFSKVRCGRPCWSLNTALSTKPNVNTGLSLLGSITTQTEKMTSSSTLRLHLITTTRSWKSVWGLSCIRYCSFATKTRYCFMTGSISRSCAST